MAGWSALGISGKQVTLPSPKKQTIESYPDRVESSSPSGFVLNDILKATISFWGCSLFGFVLLLYHIVLFHVIQGVLLCVNCVCNEEGGMSRVVVVVVVVVVLVYLKLYFIHLPLVRSVIRIHEY